jgi:transposase
MSKRRKFGPEFKRGAVEQAKQPGVSCAQLARRLDIDDLVRREGLYSRGPQSNTPTAAAGGSKPPVRLPKALLGPSFCVSGCYYRPILLKNPHRQSCAQGEPSREGC